MRLKNVATNICDPGHATLSAGRDNDLATLALSTSAALHRASTMRNTVRVVSGVSIAFEPQSGPVSALTVRSAVLLPPRFVAPNGREVLPYDVNGRMPF